MKFFQRAAVAAVAGAATVQAATSLCDKYTMALLKANTPADQYTVLTLLVNTAFIGNYTGPGTANSKLPGSMVAVPGIIAPGMSGGEQINLIQYFDGTLASTNNNGMASSMNFLDGGGATPIEKMPTSSGTKGSNQYILLTHLYQFFGVLLGCSGYSKTGFPAYGGDTNMAQVHQFMQLDVNQMNYFIMQVGLAAESFGVTATDAASVGKALNAAFNMACSAPTSIVPGAPKQPQAMCVVSGCPTASPADCSAYTMEPAPATVTPGMSMGASMTPAMSTPAMSMPAGASVISTISDGQPQAPTSALPTFTGAANALAPGAVAAAAGLLAFAL